MVDGWTGRIGVCHIEAIQTLGVPYVLQSLAVREVPCYVVGRPLSSEEVCEADSDADLVSRLMSRFDFRSWTRTLN
jgi:hypothetical protein